MIENIEDYFAKGCGRCERFATPDCATRLWAQGLAELRRICLAAGLEESLRWGHPCYRHAGRNLVLLGAFRGDFRLNFIEAALLRDPEGVLLSQGPNSQHRTMLRFTDTAGVLRQEPLLRAYLAEAMLHAEAGTKLPRPRPEIELPEELLDALDCDPELAEAFQALTPGRQRSYVIALASAKTAQTRIARIARFRLPILAGKGANER